LSQIFRPLKFCGAEMILLGVLGGIREQQGLLDTVSMKQQRPSREVSKVFG
jgi:hypothetical protein